MTIGPVTYSGILNPENSEIEGKCEKAKSLSGGIVEWEFRMEWRRRGEPVTQIDVLHVSEIFSNSNGVISVRYDSLPPVTDYMHKEPRKPLQDFRKFYLSTDLQDIAGCGDWMSGVPVGDYNVNHPQLSALLIDIARLSPTYTDPSEKAASESDRESLMTPRPPLEQSTNSKMQTTRRAMTTALTKPHLSHADVTALRRMNASANHVVNPRSIPPWGIQPAKELGFTQSVPLWAATETATFVSKKTLQMSKAHPKDATASADKDYMFAVTPSTIEFGSDFTIGCIYEIPFTLVNKDKVSRRLNVTPPAEGSHFTLVPVTPPPPNGLVAPGLSLKFIVKFEPAVLKTYRERMIVATEWSQFNIPISAIRQSPKLKLDTHIHVGVCYVGGSTKSSIGIVNHGGWGKFTIELVPGDGGSELSITPTTFEIGSGESMELFVNMSLSRSGEQTVAAVIHCDDEDTDSINLSLTASAHFPSITVDSVDTTLDSNLEVPYTFPLTSAYGVTTKAVSYTNHSAVPLICQWIAESADGSDVFSVDGDFSKEFELRPGIELESTISFKPTTEGCYNGRVVLAAVGIPTPQSEDHPFWGRELSRIPKLEPFSEADPSGFFSKSERHSAPVNEEDNTEPLYVIAVYRVVGSSVPVDVEVVPSRLDSHLPGYLNVMKQRTFQIVNHSTDRCLSYSIDSGVECSIPGMVHAMRGATITFDPQKGEVPKDGQTIINVQYTQHVIGDLEIDVVIDFQNCDSIVLPITASAVTPQITVSPKLLSLSNNGILSTASQRGVEQRVTLTNPSDSMLIYFIYYYPDHQHLESTADPESFTPLFRFDAECQLLQPKETRQATIFLNPPSEPCCISESLTLISASPMASCSMVLEEVSVEDLTFLREAFDDGGSGVDLGLLVECMALFVACVPATSEALIELIRADPATVLHHMQMIDVSKRGLGLRSSQSTRGGGIPVPVRPSAVHSNILALVENEPSLQRLTLLSSEATLQPAELSHLPSIQKIAMWTSIVCSFVLSMNQSKQSVTVEAEVQNVKCVLRPSIIKLEEVHSSVPITTKVTLKNVSGIDAVFTWGILGVEEGTEITADPPSGFLSAGASMVVELQLTVTQRDNLDLVIPCAIREAAFPDSQSTLLAVNILADYVRSLSVSLSCPSQPQPCYFNHLVETMISRATNTQPPLYIPSIDFGTIPLFESSQKLLRLRSHEGGNSTYRCFVDRYRASSIQRTNSALSLVKKGKGAIVLQKETKKGFMSVTGQEKAALKQKEQTFKAYSDQMLAEGLGVALELMNPEGALPMHNYVDIPVSLFTDLPGEYSDVINVDVDGIDSARVNVKATVAGQYIKLSENTPGLTLHRGSSPPLVTFPTNLASSIIRTRQFYVTNESNVDLELTWTVAHHDSVGEVTITDTGNVEITQSTTQPTDVQVVPSKVVVSPREGQLFKINVTMTDPGIMNAVIVCNPRSARTSRNNARFLRMGSDLDSIYEERWQQESKHASPLEIDVIATAVESKVTADPSMLKLNCRGAPAPFNPKRDGFIRPITLSNPGLATLDFRVDIEKPFILNGFSLRKGDTPSVYTTSDSIESMLFQLRSGDSLDLTVQLPWEGRQNGILAGTSGGYSSTVGSPHRQRGRVATTDISRTSRTLRVLFPQGSVQEIPVLAVVTFPALTASSNFLEFGLRPEDRNASCSKRVFLKSSTSAPAKYRISHSSKNRPLTKQTLTDVSSVPIVTMLQKESTKNATSGGISEALIDDPSVFVFDSLAGTVPGVESVDDDPGSAPQVPVVIRFAPRGNAIFESTFRVDVDGGRGCEITLRGHAVLDEYGTIVEQCKSITKAG
eukprot:TRINITY_DN875_c4_g1_i1.p1 TRINITY_DN875_c4_g1~~TRINITY_DN875_c4_g1_i1.p1  ORF type:complete len:2129 (+),score=352.86 TRINITY_DN875_c4_g1_i1:899-6388(+)